jgi:hypothetical protein
MFYGFQFERKEFVQPTSGDLTSYYGVNITAKTKLAAWFVSNCQTSVNQERYVRELGRHIPVDVFWEVSGESQILFEKERCQAFSRFVTLKGSSTRSGIICFTLPELRKFFFSGLRQGKVLQGCRNGNCFCRVWRCELFLTRSAAFLHQRP